MEVLIVGEKAHKDCVGKEGFGRDSALCLRGCQLLRQKSDGEGSMSAFFEVSHRLLWEALWGAPSASRMAWLTQQLLPAWALCVVHCCRCSPQVWLLLHNQKNWRKGRTQTKRAALEMPSRASENVSFCSGRRNDGLVSAGECFVDLGWSRDWQLSPFPHEEVQYSFPSEICRSAPERCSCASIQPGSCLSPPGAGDTAARWCGPEFDHAARVVLGHGAASGFALEAGGNFK